MIKDLGYYRAIQGIGDVTTRKQADIMRIRAELLRDFENTIDCEDVKINGNDSKLLITKTLDYTMKKIVSKPGEPYVLGDVVSWAGADWLVDVIDSDDRINTHGKMRRCTTMLRWKDSAGVIHEYPATSEDATRYGDGENAGKLVTVGDFQLKFKLHLDEHSAQINRGQRFLIDADKYLGAMTAAGLKPTAYKVTRRNVITGNGVGDGCLELTVVECEFSKRDNVDLMVADYYDGNDVYTLEITNATSDIVLVPDTTYALEFAATKNGVTLEQTDILFTSDDVTVATISNGGVITAVSRGRCVITLSVGNVKRIVEVSVEAFAPEFVIKIEPQDGMLELQPNFPKTINISIWSGDTKLTHELQTEIIGGSAYASIVSSGNDKVVIRAAANESFIGKSVVLRVRQIYPIGIYEDATFKIAGWF